MPAVNMSTERNLRSSNLLVVVEAHWAVQGTVVTDCDYHLLDAIPFFPPGSLKHKQVSLTDLCGIKDKFKFGSEVELPLESLRTGLTR